MQLLSKYISDFLSEIDPNRQALGAVLQETQQAFDLSKGGNPKSAFQIFVDRYNWLGNTANKATYKITENLARNLPGALMQDYLIHLITELLQPYPTLDIFTEVRVPYGNYPLWDKGLVRLEPLSQVVDLAVGYRMANERPVVSQDPWPRPVISKLHTGEMVMPLIVINSKIRVSQGEFFDWVGRDQLLTRGNPSCLSLQVALRSEMNLTIVEVAQVSEKFFLLGSGGERNVVANPKELDRLIEIVSEHLQEHMGQAGILGRRS